MTDTSPTIVNRFMSMKAKLLTIVGALIVKIPKLHRQRLACPQYWRSF
jgi:hypothetical protein